MNVQPLLSMLLMSLLAVLFQRIIFSLAAVVRFHPARFDPALGLHPVQYGIEHSVRPLKMIVGARFDLLYNGVTVTFAFREEGQNQRFGRGGDQFFSHGRTIHSRSMYVKERLSSPKIPFVTLPTRLLCGLSMA